MKMEFMKTYECEYIGFEQLTIFDFIEDHVCDLINVSRSSIRINKNKDKITVIYELKCSHCDKKETKTYESVETPKYSIGSVWSEVKKELSV